MKAAIYARKSNEQKGVADDAKSVARQVENAQAYAAKKGWTVADTHIYVDDGISGAEFERRPGLSQLRGLLGRRAPFQRLIVSEQKSIGREMSETSMVIKQLDEAGCEVWSYSEDKCLTPRSSLDKMLSNVQGFADENHREKSSQRVREKHSQLAKAGYVTGGRVFGYRNQDVFNGVDLHGRPLRSHVDRIIDSAEAAVVVRIFDLYDAGLGLKAITKQLRSEGAVAPKPFLRSDGLSPVAGWSPSTIRTILTRDIYHGVVVWNKTSKKNKWGKVDQQPRPESEWIRTPATHLRIVPEDLWRRVQSRRADTEGKTLRFDSGRLNGRPPKTATQNLLAGLATCSKCGGGLVVETSKRTHGPASKRERYTYYACHRRRHMGPSACTNTLRMSLPEMNEAVLQAIEEHALTPEAIESVIVLTERDDVAEQQRALAREWKDIDKKIKRLVEAISTSDEVPTSLVAKLRELEARQSAIVIDAGNLAPIPRLAPAVLENRLAEWRRLLRSSTTQARTVLQRVLRGRITFTPRADGRGYDFEGPTRFDRLFTGIAVVATDRPGNRPRFIDPSDKTGTEGIDVNETWEGDYGRLLDRAYGKITERGSCARGDSNPRPLAPEAAPRGRNAQPECNLRPCPRRSVHARVG
jgi:site-specific DNA recombinase